MNLSNLDEIIIRAVPGVCPTVGLAIRSMSKLVYHKAFGTLDPGTQNRAAHTDTRFDLASVTKLFTTTAFMTLVESGQVGWDDPVSAVLPEFKGARQIRSYEDPLNPGKYLQVVPPTGAAVDAARITFRQLLAHTSGLPAWRPLFQQPDRASAVRLAFDTFFSYPPGERVVYSDIGLILLGFAIERLAQLPLDKAVSQFVCEPLGLLHTGYRSIGARNPSEDIAPTEYCTWRQRRIIGEVHDENAACLGGISGHAGLFSTAADAATFGGSYLGKEGALLKPGTISEMRSLQAEDGNTRRGLGFLLWSPDPEAISYPLGPRAFGHTGFTGTSLWIDPDRELVIALLTNRVYHGRDATGIHRLRRDLHEEIVKQL